MGKMSALRAVWLEQVFRRLCRAGVLTSVDRCLRVLVNRDYPGFEVRLGVGAVENWLAAQRPAPLFVLGAPDAVWEETREAPEFLPQLVHLHLAVNPDMGEHLSRMAGESPPPTVFRFVPGDWEFFRTAVERRWLRDAADTWDLRDRDWLRRSAWSLAQASTLAKMLLEDADRLDTAKLLLVHCNDPAAVAAVLNPPAAGKTGRCALKKQWRRDATILGVRRYGADLKQVAAFWREWQESHPDRRFTHPETTDDSLYRMVLKEFEAMEREELREPPRRPQGTRR